MQKPGHGESRRLIKMRFNASPIENRQILSMPAAICICSSPTSRHFAEKMQRSDLACIQNKNATLCIVRESYSFRSFQISFMSLYVAIVASRSAFKTQRICDNKYISLTIWNCCKKNDYLLKCSKYLST